MLGRAGGGGVEPRFWVAWNQGFAESERRGLRGAERAGGGFEWGGGGGRSGEAGLSKLNILPPSNILNQFT